MPFQKSIHKIQQGFTLLEILLVVGIIGALAGIVILAINPGKQLADTRNSQRRSDIQTISKAVYLYNIDTSQIPLTITTTSTEICRQGASSCSSLVDLSVLTVSAKYLVAIPTDPSVTNPNGSGYFIYRDAVSGRIFVDAPLAENGIVISTNPGSSSNPVDATPPTVTMSAPANGATLSGVVAVSATASDNIGVAGVQFKLNGSNLGTEDTTSPYSISWGTTTATNGSYTLTATARDAAGNTTTATNITVTVNNSDTTPPTVSITVPANGASLQGITTITATASDNISVSGVQFRLNGVNLGTQDTTSPYSISWDTTTGANGNYTLTAVATDGTGNTTTSSVVSISVNNNDTTPPVVNISAPSNGSTAVGIVSISATASDNIGVVGVQFKLDGINLNAEDTTSPYSISWDSTTATNGSHTLTATARDASGNTTTSSGVTITVNNPDVVAPTVSITAPVTGSTVSSTITVSATASDNIGVSGVQFKLDGSNLSTEDTTSPYSISWNTTTTTNGSHALTATARDAAGNTTTSSTVTVTVNNADITPPTASITAPTAGSTIVGTTTVGATASDNIGVVGVQFKLDGINLNAEDVTSPYSISWNSTSTTNGSHTLTATARDAAGNTTTSSGVIVTVSNPDVTPPTVSVTFPTNGSTVSGSFSVSASASDNIGVVGVQFKLDGINLSAEDATSPYFITWNSATTTNGSHTLTATARDSAGNTTTSSGVTVTVNNADTTPPTVNMTAPSNGATVNGNLVSLSANASDNVGVLGVQFKVDGVNIIPEDTTSPYLLFWDSNTVTNGSHTITATARDAAGNVGTSSAVSVTVFNQAASLSVSTSGAAVVNSGTWLTGMVVSNTSPSNSITIDRVTVTWANDLRRMTQIWIGGVFLWSGSAISGTQADITDVTLPGGGAQSVDRIVFNGSMSGQPISVTFTMTDGSSKTVSMSF